MASSKCALYIRPVIRITNLQTHPLKPSSFWSYELSKRVIQGSEKAEKPEWMSVLLCGGIAGVVTWASVFPLGSAFEDPITCLPKLTYCNVKMS